MKRWCGCVVGAFSIGMAAVAGSQEMDPYKREPSQAPTAHRPTATAQAQPTQSAAQPLVKPESTAAARASISAVPAASLPPSATATSMAAAAQAAAPMPTPARPIEPSSSSGSTLRTAGIITGAAILGVGVATGIAAIAKRSSWADQCDGKSCYPSAQDSHDTGKLLADISTGTVIGGAAILAASIFLLPSGSTNPDDGSRKAGCPSVWVSVGLQGGQVTGHVEF